MAAKVYFVVEWFMPSHGPNGIWYLQDKFYERHEANARARTLRHSFNEYEVPNTEIRVRRVVGKPAAITPV